jgi:hypothetical protein
VVGLPGGHGDVPAQLVVPVADVPVLRLGDHAGLPATRRAADHPFQSVSVLIHWTVLIVVDQPSVRGQPFLKPALVQVGGVSCGTSLEQSFAWKLLDHM